MTLGFVPLPIIDAFAKLGAVSMLQDYTRRQDWMTRVWRDEPTTLTYFMNADGNEVGCYDRINQVGVINVHPRVWSDEFKTGCGIVPIRQEGESCDT
jgi:hypothetical protein